MVRAATLAVISLMLAGCQSAPRNFAAIDGYYAYDFTTAREALRHDAMLVNDEQVVLNNTRLGMAALADGDLHEAEIALGRAFELISTAGLNQDRTISAVIDHEGKRIWKGEPFEQALTYHYTAVLYALKGDWENVRAAAANSLFRLADFGADQAQRSGDQDYTVVDSNFALGFLLEAIGSDLSGTAGAQEQFDAALKINPDLQPVVDRLRARDYDTLLIVDYGKGPTKIAYGPDMALSRFEIQERPRGQLQVTAARGAGGAGHPLARANATCDVNQMALDLRWNNLENVRLAKSMIGEGLIAGGALATMYGADRREGEVALAGIGAIALGLLSKAGAKADTRYCEFMPQSVYLVPLKLGEARNLRVTMEGDSGATIVLPDVTPGQPGSPRAVYLRLHGRDSVSPHAWLTARRELYSNDHTGVMTGPDGYPWILGGRDVSTPSRATLEAYQANGFLLDMTVQDLRELYAAEGIALGAGAETRPGVPRNPSFRHILEGGTGLFTPEPTSIGYKRIMFSPHGRYRPKSELVRNAAASIRVAEGEGIKASRQPVKDPPRRGINRSDTAEESSE